MSDDYKELYLALKQEYTEYMEYSKSIEAELEAELNNTTKKLKTTTEALNAVNNEFKQYKIQQNQQLNDLQSKIDAQKEQLRKKVELEIENDKLQTETRVMESSNEDLLQDYNILLERISDLETQLEFNEGKEVEVQRLKDQLKDTNLEISILQDKYNKSSNHIEPHIHKTTLENSVVNDTITIPETPKKTPSLKTSKLPKSRIPSLNSNAASSSMSGVVRISNENRMGTNSTSESLDNLLKKAKLLENRICSAKDKCIL